MKKVLMLGGAPAQIPAIKKAKEMGLYVITCDYLPNNPGHAYADEYYNVSTTDKEEVLKLAQKLKIDGIVCYASDPSALTAAYVAENMGLPTSPYESVKILSNKDLFRKFLSENGFNTPKANGYSSVEEAIQELSKYKFPVIIKPVDSSGSKGVTKLEKNEEKEARKQIEYAMSFSRAKRVIIEEFVEKYGYQIAGDGFSVDGKLVFRAFANDHFDTRCKNPYVPVGASWPYDMPNEIHEKIHKEIQRCLTLLNMKTGAYNFDIRIDKDMNVYLMEIGPRNGGNMIPQVMEYTTGIDLVEYTIKAAIGEDCSDLKMPKQEGFWAYYALHSLDNGIFKELHIDEEFEKDNLVELHLYVKTGEKISEYIGSNTTVGIMIVKFSSKEEMLEKIDNMDKWVKVVLQ